MASRGAASSAPTGSWVVRWRMRSRPAQLLSRAASPQLTTVGALLAAPWLLAAPLSVSTPFALQNPYPLFVPRDSYTPWGYNGSQERHRLAPRGDTTIWTNQPATCPRRARLVRIRNGS
ncbi:hypothetical protein NITHO_2290003 [Nitrolancea hollandica Lb]|uniref:Uncharacterized protein n=1 Tax=Nitrolancea hollandica Lb TaxID=1129897 RepID=I4EFG3_9BACT|nr:hypothetical protein NITHO_2290003 [Nitrolancea hollandica Lb]